MEQLCKQPVFVSGTKQYDWADVLYAAGLKGSWKAVFAQTRLSLACQIYARETGLTIAATQVEDIVNEFRYDRALVASEAMKRWLAQWNLSWNEVIAYCRRAWFKQHLAELWPEITDRILVCPVQVASVIRAEAICSGALFDLAYELAGRAALNGHDNASTRPPLAPAQLPELTMSGLAALVPALPAERMQHLAQLETTYQQAKAQAHSPSACLAHLAAHPQDWLHFEWQCLWFAEAHTAQEAALCLREDGVPLATLAHETERPLCSGSGYLHELEPAWQPLFLTAPTNALLGPLELDGEYFLFALTRKHLPTELDTELEQAIAARLWADRIDAAIQLHVRWLLL